jgi:hypothetical protein
MSTPKGYNCYRGRSPKWKPLVVILLTVVIVVAAGFLFLQKYLVYDGGVPHLQLPTKTGTQSSAASSGTDAKITIDKPSSSSGASSGTSTTTGTVQALQLSELPLTDWDAVKSHLETSGTTYHSVVLTVKDYNGSVFYDSAAAAAVSDSAVNSDPATASAITAMTGSSYHTVARLSCFQDPVAAQADKDGMGLKNSRGNLFHDANHHYWTDPSKEKTRTYLTSLVRECVSMGFKEILLTDFTYPTQGELSKIQYGDGQIQENLTGCLTAIRTALSGTDVKLSIELPADVITSGSDKNAGLTLSEIAPLVDCVYTQTDAANADALASSVASASSTTAFVPELTGTPSGSSYLVLG